MLLSTATLVGALSGYAGRGYAQAVGGACSGAMGIYQCSGTYNVPQSITADDAEVTVVAPGLIVDTTGVGATPGDALTITGAGAISLTDPFLAPYSSLTAGAGYEALSISSTGDIGGGNAGSVTVNVSGAFSGGDDGIEAINGGSGLLSITANGDVEGIGGDGIFAQNNNGNGTTVTTYGEVTGGGDGIEAQNYGGGMLTVSTYGNVSGLGGALLGGIRALNQGTDLTVTTGQGTTVYGAGYGIQAANDGSGALTIEANSDVDGGDAGIQATNNGNGTLTITANGNVTGTNDSGIFADNNGSGALSVTANGDVDGGDEGIEASNSANGTDLSVTTSASLNGVTGADDGIEAINSGSGLLSITANGDVEGGGDGIFAENSASGNGTSVTTGLGTEVTGDNDGIEARNLGGGALNVTTNGDVFGFNADLGGIRAENQGTTLTVTTHTDSMVYGAGYGIQATNNGSGALTIEANGDVTGDTRSAIFARDFGAQALTVTANGTVTGVNANGISAENSASGTAVNVTTGADSDVSGRRGIRAINDGSQALTVEANGMVTGTYNEGISAENSAAGTNLTVNTGANSMVEGYDFGVRARNAGSGATTVIANGDVESEFDAIYAANTVTGNNVAVTAGPGSNVVGNYRGISALNNGAGSLTVMANGNVEGTVGYGIFAYNSNAGTGLTVTTGTGSNVAGGNSGIHALNRGGTLTVTINGNVTSDDTYGVYARSYAGGGPINIMVNETGTVTSNGIGAAIEIGDGATDVTVAGVLNGGAGGAVRFDQTLGENDRVELHPTFVINGNVLAGGGIDTLSFGGAGDGNFDLADIGAGQQFQDFEAFRVESGTWSFTGVTGEDFTVDGGTVMGTGTFGDLTVITATLAPGNSIGTMTVNGAFTLGAGAIFEVEVNAAGQSDRVIVNGGIVNLTGATLQVLAANGNYKPSTDYTIIDNDGNDPVQGQFAQTFVDLAFLTVSVNYAGGDGNDVVLTLGRNSTLFTDVANTPNQRAVAGALDRFPADNPLFLAVLNQTEAGARQAFDALSGEIHATVSGTLADDSRYMREAVLGRLMQASHAGGGNTQVAALGAGGPQVASLDSSAMALGYAGGPQPIDRSPIAFWTRGFGAWGNFDGNGNAATADRDLGGFISGMDAQMSGSWRAGLATGASFSNVDVDARAAAAEVESYTLGGYLGGMTGAFALRGGGLWAWSGIDTSRAVIFPGFFERQNASYDADTGQLFGEVAYPTQVGGVALEPFAGLAYVSIDSETFRERGGALASLRGSSEDQDVGYSTVGLRAATTMQWGAMLVIPHVSAAWQHAFDDITPGAALAFATTGIGFAVEGVPLAQDTALLDAGLDLALGENTSAGVSYSGQFGGGVTDNAVKGRFTSLF